MAPRRRQGQEVLGDGLDGRVEDVAEPRNRDPHLVEILPDLRQPQDGGAHLRGQHVECDEFANSQLVSNDEPGSGEKRKHRRGLVEQAGCLRRDIAEHCGAERGPDIGGKLLFPFSLHERLDSHRLDGLDACDAFDEEGLVRRAVMEFLFQTLAEERRYGNR